MGEQVEVQDLLGSDCRYVNVGCLGQVQGETVAEGVKAVGGVGVRLSVVIAVIVSGDSLEANGSRGDA